MPAAPAFRRVVQSFRQSIEAPPGVVFPLLCPVRETEWLDGWTFRMIHSASGLAEPGAVFATEREGEPETIWIVSRHDPGEGRVEFCRFTPGSRTCRLRLAVSPAGATRSTVDVTYEHTSLGPQGDEFLDGWNRERFVEAMRTWEASMNHFLRTGFKLVQTDAR